MRERHVSIDLSRIGNGLARDERETIISTTDADNEWTIYTSSPAMARKLLKLAEAMGVTVTAYGTHGIALCLPSKSVSLRKPLRLSDQERERRAAVLRGTRAVSEGRD